jgi:hypothetical protein
MPTSMTVDGPRCPRPGTELRLQRGLLGAGPNLDAELLDLDAFVLRVRVAAAVRPGDTVYVTLRPAGGGPPVTRVATVGSYESETIAGLRFRHPLTRRDLNCLTGQGR